MRTFNFLVAILILTVSLCSADAECPDCSIYANGALIRDPEDCAHYYKCVNGHAVRKYCGRGFNFDDRFSICNFASLVDCGPPDEESSEESCVPETPPCKTTTVSPTTHTHRRKRTATTTTCKRTVSFRTTTCKPAPAPATTCTTPRPCGKDSEAPSECSDNKLPNTLQSLSDCKGQKDGTILLDGKHCHRYYVCRNGKAKHERCSRGLFFDGLSKTCKNRKDCPKCPANCD